MLSGLCLDFDGTMFHNERVHQLAIRTVMEQYTEEAIDPDELLAYVGLPYYDRLEHMLAMRGIDDEGIIRRLETQARQIMAEKLHPKELLVPGLPEFLNTAKQVGLKIAVVSSALHQRIVADITSVDLIHYIDTIVGVDDVTCRKPHPEPYLKALAALGLAPTETIAFEDSPPGVESAWLADLPVVGLLTNFPAADLGKAQLLIRDYTEVTLQQLQQLC